MDVEEIIWPIIRMMNGDGSMWEADYIKIIDALRGQNAEITQLRAELEQERELADRLCGAIVGVCNDHIINNTALGIAVMEHATRRNK